MKSSIVFTSDGQGIDASKISDEHKRTFIKSQVTYRKGHEERAEASINDMEGEELEELYRECIKEYKERLK